MSSPEPIGGYFGLEPGPPSPYPHKGLLALSSGRACCEYVLRAAGATHVHLPRYTCDVMLEPLARLGLPHSFYAIDDALEIAALPELEEGHILLYTNYFGIKDRYCRGLADRFGGSLILDCSQALFFEPPGGAHSFYSPRKFVGIPDGGLLATELTLDAALETDASDRRYSHLVGRLDRGPEAAYRLFQENEADLSGQPIRLMSRSTRRLLETIDFLEVKRARRKNFAVLHERLKDGNLFTLPAEPVACPMVYPYLTGDGSLRRRLIEERVFVATYWPNVLQWCGEGELEYRLAERLLPLPIDQRYGRAQMERIAGLVLGGAKGANAAT
jgi:hypothetical protein